MFLAITYFDHGTVEAYENDKGIIYEFKKGNILGVEIAEATFSYDKDEIELTGLPEKVMTHVTVKDQTLKVAILKVNGTTITPDSDGLYHIAEIDNAKIIIDVTLIDKCSNYKQGYDDTLVTLESLTTGHHTITTTFDGKTYYLPTSGEKNGKGSPLVEEYTDYNDIWTNDVWDITVNEGKILITKTIGGNTYYLATVKDNNGVRIQKETPAKDEYWEIIDGGLCYHLTGRYLGVYGGTDFRSYTRVNATNYKDSSTSFKFYLYEEGLTSNHVMTKSEAVAPTCDNPVIKNITHV